MKTGLFRHVQIELPSRDVKKTAECSNLESGRELVWGNILKKNPKLRYSLPTISKRFLFLSIITFFGYLNPLYFKRLKRFFSFSVVQCVRIRFTMQETQV